MTASTRISIRVGMFRKWSFVILGILHMGAGVYISLEMHVWNMNRFYRQLNYGREKI